MNEIVLEEFKRMREGVVSSLDSALSCMEANALDDAKGFIKNARVYHIIMEKILEVEG